MGLGGLKELSFLKWSTTVILLQCPGPASLWLIQFTHLPSPAWQLLSWSMQLPAYCNCTTLFFGLLALFSRFEILDAEKWKRSHGLCVHHSTWVLLQTDSALRRTRYVSTPLSSMRGEGLLPPGLRLVRALHHLLSPLAKWLKPPHIPMRQAKLVSPLETNSSTGSPS